MLQAHSDLNLIVGSDQGIEGAVQAIGKKKVILVGYGGSATGIQGVAAGKWYGDVAQLPASEGRLATEAAIKAVRTGAKAGGVRTRSPTSRPRAWSPRTTPTSSPGSGRARRPATNPCRARGRLQALRRPSARSTGCR